MCYLYPYIASVIKMAMPGRTPISPTVEPDQDLPTVLDEQAWLLPVAR